MSQLVCNTCGVKIL